MASSVTKSLALAAIVSSAALYDTSVDAHQYVILPAPTFTVKTRAEQFNPLAFLENQGFKTTADFDAYYKAKGYKTLRAFMDDKSAYKVADGADFECGWTKLAGTPQPIPSASTVRSTGYTHDGPCEVWLDKTRVLKGTNCHSEFPGTTFKIDYSSCKGSCVLRWYWMGIRFLKGQYSWQVYKNCVPITGSRSLDTDDEIGAEYDEYASSNSTSDASMTTTAAVVPKATLAVESPVPTSAPAGCKTKKKATATPAPASTDDEY